MICRNEIFTQNGNSKCEKPSENDFSSFDSGNMGDSASLSETSTLLIL